MSWNPADLFLLAEICGINLILSGDNALVVGMSLRKLPAHQRKTVSALGITAAVLVQYAATLTVASLLQLYAVSCIGGILLVWIAINLLRDNGSSANWLDGSSTILLSTLTVMVEYLVMCPDNILAVAAVARTHAIVLALGLILSGGALIPGSLLVARLMKRYPLIVTAGAALLGWTAGTMISSGITSNAGRMAISFASAVIVMTSPWWLGSRSVMLQGPVGSMWQAKDRDSG